MEKSAEKFRQSIEPGLMIFIKKKLEYAVPPLEVVSMLQHAGFELSQIEQAFREVYNIYPDTHQDLAAANGFLPPLLSKAPANLPEGSNDTFTLPPFPSIFKKVDEKATGAAALSSSTVFSELELPSPQRVRKPLFSGRMHRRDFILAFLFVFGIGMVVLLAALTLIQLQFHDVYEMLLTIVTTPETSALALIALPLLLAPITVMLLSVISRRLHDINLSELFALGFLVFFVSPFEMMPSFRWGIPVLQLMMVILFAVLLTKKGDQQDNQYGPRTPYTTSFFARLMNIVIE